MKNCLYVVWLSLFSNATAFAQNTDKPLSDSAFHYYLKSDYSNALLFYQKLISASNEDASSFYINNAIGNCYKKLGKDSQAIQFYKLAINNFDETLNPVYTGRTTCLDIAHCYYNLSQLDSCRVYLNKSKSWNTGKHTHSFSRDFNQNLFHLYMKYYEKTGQLDSAIIIFAPHAFDEWTDNNYVYPSIEHIHEGDYHCKVFDFIEILKQKYSVSAITEELHNTIQTSSYTLATNETDSSININIVTYCGSSRTYFFGIKLENWTSGCLTYKKNEPHSKWRKEIRKGKKFLIYQIKSSLLYRLFKSGAITDNI